MSATDRFLDTNVLLYLLSGDDAKATIAERLLVEGGTISVQVLNEFASVCRRKLQLPFDELREILGALYATLNILPLSLKSHQSAIAIAERYGYSVYDAGIVAAALEAGCNTLLTEDLQNGQTIDHRLTIFNPFKG